MLFVCYKLFRLLLLVVLFFVIDMWIICVVKLLYKYIYNKDLIKCEWVCDSNLFVLFKIVKCVYDDLISGKMRLDS